MGSSLTNSVEVRSDPIGPPSGGREGLDVLVPLAEAAERLGLSVAAATLHALKAAMAW
jgi:hypothetical protein